MSADPPNQLLLELPLEPRLGREDFLVGQSNERALDLLESWPDWPAPTLMLVGPEGSGKSHLAAIWAQQSRAEIVEARYVARRAIDTFAGPLVLENVDDAAVQEAALFHLLNALRGDGMPLLMTARTRPDHWRLKTPDLLSRLRLSPVAEIAAPDDALLRALIVKLFIDRQLMVDTNVVEYVLTRMERSITHVAAAVEALDREAMVLGRRVTRSMAARILGRTAAADS